ncbi:MAG: cobaltochelatase subunit CobN [Proteobacteria bacterium]|nr:cobaltochelatase subunit CobN [Pseudomonadota bacterium]
MHQVKYESSGDLASGAKLDLAQSPADIVILTAATSEINLFAKAAADLGWGEDALRLANILSLSNPHTIDHYCDDVLQHAKLILVRLLGGVAYWRYGCDKLARLARSHNIALGFIAGDGRPDPQLMELSTIGAEVLVDFAAYADNGGADNARGLLLALVDRVDGTDTAPPPKPLLSAGLYCPGALVAGKKNLPKNIKSLGDLKTLWRGWGVMGCPVVAVVFYRALMQSADTEAIDALLAAMLGQRLAPLPMYCLSLKDPTAKSIIASLLAEAGPEVIINATSFATSAANGKANNKANNNVEAPPPFDVVDAPIIQAMLATTTEAEWQASSAGLSARDMTMQVVLPELDGRITSRAIGFKTPPKRDPLTQAMLTHSHAKPCRVAWVAELAAAWVRLRATPPKERRLTMVLANYPNRDGRLANGVGLDTPASVLVVLAALKKEGYAMDGIPKDVKALMAEVQSRPTNSLANSLAEVKSKTRQVDAWLPLSEYKRLFAKLPQSVQETICDRWGDPETDPFCMPMTNTMTGAMTKTMTGGQEGDKGFALPVRLYGAMALAVQPARGYNIDPKESYHSPDLPPPHNYLAFYLWARWVHGSHAFIHLGKHGNLEWLPGKALALDATSLPEVCMGAMPHLYPFIVNDPGEGSQAKRRVAAVILDHLTPPLTEAGSHGVMAELETSMDEYYEASGMDGVRSRALMAEIIEVAEAGGLLKDCGIGAEDDDDEKLRKLDNFLCDIKEMQIKDGLHVYGKGVPPSHVDGLLLAMLRTPRGEGEGEESLIRALAADIFAGEADFDPLVAEASTAWRGSKPSLLQAISKAPWRTAGDTRERLSLLAAELVGGRRKPEAGWRATKPIITRTLPALRQALIASAANEYRQLLRGLAGKYVPAGQAGAPTRGRIDVLPTGRNFFSLDSRAVPTPAAWRLGWASANALLDRYKHDHGKYPQAIVVTAWGTANMRTGGDDLAQSFALLGAKPRWEGRRVVGFDVLPLSLLGRPRVDVTLRISGFFRDAFPQQMILMDRVIRAVANLDESPDMNPLAGRVRGECKRLMANGLPASQAGRHASYRLFSSKPGAYGAGLQTLIDENLWEGKEDFAEAFLTWGAYAYGEADGHDDGAGGEGWQATSHRHGLERQLAVVDAVIHNQDNREHDILDSDDYYQFTGGLAASIAHVKGEEVPIYMGDHALPESPRIRALSEEIARVIRGRASNPKWIAGVMRHGYKGAFEMAATLDYLFAFAATTGQVESHHFDALFASWIEDDKVAEFIRNNNEAAYYDMLERFHEAMERGLWQPRRNVPMAMLSRMRDKPTPRPSSP